MGALELTVRIVLAVSIGVVTFFFLFNLILLCERVERIEMIATKLLKSQYHDVGDNDKGETRPTKMQYTGLKDKHDRGICVGDIIRREG